MDEKYTGFTQTGFIFSASNILGLTPCYKECSILLVTCSTPIFSSIQPNSFLNTFCTHCNAKRKVPYTHSTGTGGITGACGVSTKAQGQSKRTCVGAALSSTCCIHM